MHFFEVERFPLGFRFLSALPLQFPSSLLFFSCLLSCFFLVLPLDSLKFFVLGNLCVRPPHTTRIALVLLVQIRSGLHRWVVLVLGVPRREGPDEFLLDFIVDSRVVTHVSEGVSELAIGEQSCYDVIKSENQIRVYVGHNEW